jgi:hypothetical protein
MLEQHNVALKHLGVEGTSSSRLVLLPRLRGRNAHTDAGLPALLALIRWWLVLLLDYVSHAIEDEVQVRQAIRRLTDPGEEDHVLVIRDHLHQYFVSLFVGHVLEFDRF